MPGHQPADDEEASGMWETMMITVAERGAATRGALRYDPIQVRQRRFTRPGREPDAGPAQLPRPAPRRPAHLLRALRPRPQAR